jgi:hypothetical protein
MDLIERTGHCYLSPLQVITHLHISGSQEYPCNAMKLGKSMCGSAKGEESCAAKHIVV